MRILFPLLLLAACQAEPDPAGNTEANAPAAPAPPTPGPAATSPVAPLSRQEIADAALDGPGCTWRRAGREETLFVAYPTEGLIRLDGAVLRLRHDVPPAQTAMDAVGAYVAEGVSVRAERVPGSRPTPAGPESVTRPAELVVTRGDRTMRIGPGELLCGS